MHATRLGSILLGLAVTILGTVLPAVDAHNTDNNDTSPIYHAGNTTLIAIKDNQYGVRNVSYFVADGLAIVDGDVVYGTVEDLLHHSQDSTQISRSLSTFSGPEPWPYATLPYKFDSDATQSILGTIVDTAIGRWKAGSLSLNFTKVANSAIPENGVIMITAIGGAGCWAHIGYANAPRRMNLQPSCSTAPGFCGADEATHEFGHLLGLYHEHQRPDRESFVHYNCANLDPTCPSMPANKTCCDTEHPVGCCSLAGNFATLPHLDVAVLRPYDPNSIMQYRPNAFAIPQKFTLTSVRQLSNVGMPSPDDYTNACLLLRDPRVCAGT